jgi:DNA polymerase delta subunit 1
METSQEETLMVFPYEWVYKDSYTDEDNLAIHAWCLDKNSVPYFLRIEDFPILCYVELPQYVNNRFTIWTEDMARVIYNYLVWRLEGADHSPFGFLFSYKKKTYYYFGEVSYPMIMLRFKNMESMKHCENLLNYPIRTKRFGNLKCRMWESKIPPIRKMLTNQRMSYSQWFTVKGKKVDADYRISSVENEYIVQFQTMEAVPNDICDGWRINFRVLAFDIECYSDNKRMFPDAWCAKHQAYIISCIYQVSGYRDTRKRYAIILGKCSEIPKERLDNTSLIHVESEEELIDKFAELIMKLDPEIVTGYNIFGFDYMYLHIRLIQRMLEWPVMGRIPAEKAVMEDQEWNSGAYGHNIIYDLKMNGRINVDLLPIIRRDHKLLKYTLDYVAGHFLNAHKHDITAMDIFVCIKKVSRHIIQSIFQ